MSIMSWQLTQKSCIELWKEQEKTLKGLMLKSYRVLHLYAQMVRDTNPSSIFVMQLERPKINITPTFKRFFYFIWCYEERVCEWLQTCIGVDECHLKWPYRGVLLTVVALNGNCGLFLIIVVIMKLENGDL